MNRKIGFGIIGCGVIADWHIRGIENAQYAKLVAVCDANETKARNLGEKKKVDYYTKMEEMLKRQDLDVICICTPSSLHPEQAVLAANAGKHIITEKPMAITLEKADEMINACKKNRVKLATIFQRRVTEPFASIKKAFENNELGKLILGDCCLKYYRGQAYYDSAGWRGTWKFDGGGALMNQGIHMIDILQWLMGDVEEVFSYSKTLARKIEVEDTSVSVLNFKNGAVGIIECATSVFPSTIPHRLEVHGEKGSILFEGEGVKRWVTGGPDGEPVEKVGNIENTGKSITSPTDISDAGHRIQIQDMVEAIKENRDPMVTGEEGRKALEIILAIYKSSKTGMPVKLPLK
ncbi:MAG: hypothetical protein A3J83_01400 [Elusimicrobia bacterium RIFOXYA2_FULL_40_6]|nr:MAG: hypothetical protein A3J83_01400 [Elusimicrobia bacterium RIFOXYA2_FULL_40_6]